MARDKKPGSLKVPLAGLGGFILGATTVLLVVYLYGQLSGRQTEPRTISPPPPMAAPTPSSAAPPPQVQRPRIPGSETTATPAPESPATEISPALPPVPPPPDLAARELMVPVQGATRKALQDTFNDARSQGRVHDAIDILAPRNTPVLAVEAGRIPQLFTRNKRGFTIYQFDPTSPYCY